MRHGQKIKLIFDLDALKPHLNQFVIVRYNAEEDSQVERSYDITRSRFSRMTSILHEMGLMSGASEYRVWYCGVIMWINLE